MSRVNITSYHCCIAKAGWGEWGGIHWEAEGDASADGDALGNEAADKRGGGWADLSCSGMQGYPFTHT